MIDWQRQLGDVAEAFAAAERSRARSLVDQIATAHVDLLAGLPAGEAEPLRQHERTTQMKLASLEKQLELARQRKDLPAGELKGQIEKLESQAAEARQGVVGAYVAIRNASPAYRQMVGQNFLPKTLSEIQAQLAGDEGLVLEYVLGQKAGYLIVIPAKGEEPRVETLVLDEAQAAALGVEAGPLTAGVLSRVLSATDGSGCSNCCRASKPP